MKKTTAKIKKPKKTGTDTKDVQKIIGQVLESLSVEGDFTLNPADTQDDVTVIDVSLATQDSGVVIGYHGEVLEALQLVLSLALSKKLGKFVRVTIEIDDYRKNRIAWLENIALNAKQKVLAQQEEISLPSLKSWERRIVHLLLQDDGQVMSESIGEGKNRTLVIKPRSS